jgi:hypothetical protein
MLELKHEIELAALGFAKVARTVYIDEYGFSDSKRAVRLEHLAPERSEDLMASLGGEVMLLSRENETALSIRKGVFIDNIYNVAPEADNAAVKPEAHYILYLLKHGRIMPVEVGLFFREEVQIILVTTIAEWCPGAFGKEIAPVVRQFSALSLLDYVIIAVFLLAGERAAKPLVLI